MGAKPDTAGGRRCRVWLNGMRQPQHALHALSRYRHPLGHDHSKIPAVAAGRRHRANRLATGHSSGADSAVAGPEVPSEVSGFRWQVAC